MRNLGKFIKAEEFWACINPIHFSELKFTEGEKPTVFTLMGYGYKPLTKDECENVPVAYYKSSKQPIWLEPQELLDFNLIEENGDKITTPRTITPYQKDGEIKFIIHGSSSMEDFGLSGIKEEEPKGPKVIGKIELPHTKIFGLFGDSDAEDIQNWTQVHREQNKNRTIHFHSIEVKDHVKGKKIDVLKNKCNIIFMCGNEKYAKVPAYDINMLIDLKSNLHEAIEQLNVTRFETDSEGYIHVCR